MDKPRRGAVVLTISSGHSADYLLGAVATGRESYYTGAVAAGEPPGQWYGAGADQLGLRGVVDAQDMRAVYGGFLDPRDPRFRDPEQWDRAATLGHGGRAYATAEELYVSALSHEPYADAERREQLRLDASKSARSNVAFLDATFSVQKSITVLHAAFEAQEVAARQTGDHEAAAAWRAHRQVVEDAIWAGNNAALDYLASHAGYSRIGHHGGAAGRFIDAHDWVVGSFFQHDNRNHDPQLHIHNAVLNRVAGADGVWRTVDSRAMHKYRAAAAAVGERTMEARLAATLGVRLATRPDGKAREIVGIPKHVLDLFSTRRRAITAKTSELVIVFEERFGRSPNALERDRLQRQATFATRPAKTYDGETVIERLERWDRALRAEVTGGLATVASAALAQGGHSAAASRWSVRDVIDTALADVQSKKSAWTRPDLTRAISDALPDWVGDLGGAQMAALLTELTEAAVPLVVRLTADRPAAAAVPDSLRLADGRSAYAAPAAELYATPDHVHTERLLTRASDSHSAAAISADAAREYLGRLELAGVQLSLDQSDAVAGVLTSGAPVECLVGPAGTGKSRVIGVLADAWRHASLPGPASGRVVGLASSQIATDVLAAEGVAARNVTRWLASQERLDAGTHVPDDVAWQLRPSDLVVVDESTMTDTADLAAIHRYAKAAGAKLLLTGDHRQLAAVGPAGGTELVAAGVRNYELTEAHRFAEAWEGKASLRLRNGDVGALAEYHKHGRLLDAGTIEHAEQTAIRAYLADTVSGLRSLLVVDTNDQAARLSAQVRAQLVRLGRVSESGIPLERDGGTVGVGDVVQARWNGWHLAGYAGNRRGPINRERYRVDAIDEDGTLIVAPLDQPDQRLTLPSSYVAEHVTLGYASTVQSAQGVTVDSSHAVITQRTGPAAIYVALSRGRHSNTAHVGTRVAPDDMPPGLTHQAVRRDPVAVLAAAFDRDMSETLSALATAGESERDAGSMRTAAELFIDACEVVTAGRTASWLDELAADGCLTAKQRAELAAEDGAATLNRVLRQVELAGHDARQVLREAVTARGLADARQLSNLIHHRITHRVSLDPAGDRFADWIPHTDNPLWQRYLTQLAVTADRRRDDLGHAALTNPPAWAVDALGPPPADPIAARRWSDAVSAITAHRELAGAVDEASALPDAPKAGQPEHYASWRAAWRALGRPEADRAEAELSDGQLLVRVRAYQREVSWAPRYVANELAGTRQAAQHHRDTAVLRAAEAEAAGDDRQRVQMERQSAEAKALADALDERAVQLAEGDEARSTWYAHTAGTRAAADGARAELARRRAANPPEDTDVTAAEVISHAEARDTEHADDSRAARGDATDIDTYASTRDVAAVPDPDQGRTAERDEPTITDDSDFANVTRQRESDRRTLDESIGHSDTSEPAPADIRQQHEQHSDDREEHVTRVPTTDEAAESLRRARRTLAEIRRREEQDRQAAADRRQTDVEHQVGHRERDRADDDADQQ